jgi:DNA-binding MltR family transcriptional regulator
MKTEGAHGIKRVLTDLYQHGLAGIVLVGAATADQQLQDAILSKMRKLSSKQTNELFTGFGPLSSFSAKTAVAYALGLIDVQTRQRLDGVRKIRNSFAHADELTTFNDANVRTLMSKLPPDAPTDKKNEQLYFWHLCQVEEHLVASAGPHIRRSSAEGRMEA